MAESARPKGLFSEIGSTGLNYQQGQFLQEEFKAELRGLSGVETYAEMSLSPIVGAILFVIEQMVCQVDWKIAPFSDDNEDKEPAEFIKGALFDDMSASWADTLTEVCTMFTYGWAYLETVFKMRRGTTMDPGSKFDDGKIGWRKWALRGQNTLSGWDFDDTGGIRGMIQESFYPQHFKVTIPIAKALLFRTRVEKNNPEGLSILRRGYRNFWYAKRFEEIEAIGIERDLAGLPVLKPPPDLDLWNPKDAEMAVALTAAQNLIQRIRRGEKEGVLIPDGWTLELLASGSRRQFDLNQTITRHETRIAQSALADFIFLGQGKTGSWSLSSDKTDLFILSLKAYLVRIKEVVNRHAIPRLMELNGMDVTRPPALEHGDIETQNLTELASYLSALASMGALIFPDKALEDHLRLVAGLPEAPEQPEIPLEPALPQTPAETEETFKRLMKLREMIKGSNGNGKMDDDERRVMGFVGGAVQGRRIGYFASSVDKHGDHDQSTHGNRGGGLASTLTEQGGFTANPIRFKGRTPPKDGFAFSIRPDTEQKISSSVRRDELRQKIISYVREHREDIKAKGNYLGGWRDDKIGNIYLDISRVEKDRPTALKLARAAKQLAIYDLGKGVSIDVKEAA